MKSALILLVICAFTAAMVPRERRAINTEEESAPNPAPTSNSAVTAKQEICAPTTPCHWVFKNKFGIAERDVPNSYCRCSDDTSCTYYNAESDFDVYRCTTASDTYQQDSSES